jgi:hypothetical protein
MRITSILGAVAICCATVVNAQTPSPAAPAVDDTPSFKIGGVLFGDYTYQSSPKTLDSDGNSVHASSFNISRAYVNVTGKLNHWILFRITPEATRETGSGSSLNGSQTFRLKFAFAQFNLDDWAPKGTWVRFGVQQTPLIDYEEQIYRYRFQGPTFADREGYIGASDAGLSAHFDFPGNHGDIHGGIYNGDGYNRADANDQKSVQLRASLRPLPASPLLKGLRITGFINSDHVVQGAKRERVLEQVTYEHPRFNAGFDHISTTDASSSHAREIDGDGYSIWATPRLTSQWELLLRHDDLKPDDKTSQHRTRNIAGVAYWVPNLQKVTAAFLADYDSLEQKNYSPARPKDTRYGLKMLIQF